MPKYVDVDYIDLILEKNQSEAKFENRKQFAKGIREARRIIRNMPTADVAEVRHGKWIDLHDEDVLYEQTYKCSDCGECFVLETGTPQENEYNYCPHCGAKMNRKEDGNGKTNM